MISVIQRFANDDKLKEISDRSHEETRQKVFLTECSASAEGMLYFSQGSWQLLTKLRLWTGGPSQNMKIGSLGCKYLSRASLPRIQQITLSGSAIGTEGVCHLSKAKWGNLKQIRLSRNNIGEGALDKLARANWAKLNFIRLYENSISASQLKNLVLCESKELRLNVGYNPIGFQKGAIIRFFRKKQYSIEVN